MTYDWEPYKDTCYRVYVEEKKSLRQLHKYLQENHNFAPSLRGLHHRLQQWNFPAKVNPAYKNEALIARIKELWEANHRVQDTVAILQDEGFDVQEREINRIRQKNGWLLRVDAVHYTKRRTQTSTSRDASQGDADGDEEDGVDGEGGTGATPNFGNITPNDALPSPDFSHAQAEAFQEARKHAIAVEAEERRVTKKRRRWTKGRAGLPADPPGPPRFPSELSLTECKAVLSLDPANYKDIRAKFRDLCQREGVSKKTVAGPQKWEATKLALVRESMHLRGVFWDNLDLDQKNLALDIICGDVTKGIRSESSRMLLHEARNILGLNPRLGRDVRFHFQKILHEDHFVGKTVAGEEHWNELLQRWLGESDVIRPVAESLAHVDPDTARQRKKALEVVARDAMKRFRDAEARGTIAKMMAYEHQDQDAHGETDYENGANSTAMEMTGFDDGSFEAAQAAQIAAQLTMEAIHHSDRRVSDAAVPVEAQEQAPNPAVLEDNQTLPEPPAAPKRKRGRPRKVPSPETPAEAASGEPPAKKRGRPRKVPDPETPAEAASGEPPAKKRRSRQQRIPHEEALRIYAHSQARFMPPDASSGPESSVSAEPEARGAFTASSQAFVATPAPVPSTSQARAASTPAPVPTPTQRAAATAIYFRLHPSSTVTGVSSMWIATLTTRSVDELRSKAIAKCPGATCAVIDGIVKDDGVAGGEIPLPIPGDTELGAYLDHMREVHGPPTFSVRLVGGG